MKNVWATTGCVSLRLDKIKEHESSTDHINSVAIEALRIKVHFFSQRLRIKVPFSEVAPCPFEILARTLDVNHVCGLLKANGLQQYIQTFLGTVIL